MSITTDRQYEIVWSLREIFPTDRAFDSSSVAAELLAHPKLLDAMAALAVRPVETGITGCLDAIVETDIIWEGVRLERDPLGYRLVWVGFDE